MSADFSLHRFRAFADLNPEEKAALYNLGGDPILYRRNQIIRHEGDVGPGLYLLHRGWIGSSIRLSEGDRQFLKLHLPGDVLGAPSLALTEANDTLVALTDARVSLISLDALGVIFQRSPRLGAIFFLAAQEERASLMDRVVSLGRMNASQRIAHFLIELHQRLGRIKAQRDGFIELPLSQEMIGDLVGLSAVYVNRTIRKLEKDGCIRRKRASIELVDQDRLRDMSGLPQRHLRRNPDWLPPACREGQAAAR
jgi:CRP-like cAMP-binding protein